MTPPPATNRRVLSLVLAALLYGGLLFLLKNREVVFAFLRLEPDGAFRSRFSLCVLTAAWCVGAYLVIRLIDLVVWDFTVARAIKSPVPGALKALGVIVIVCTTATCIVGLVFERSVTGFVAALGAVGFAMGLALRNLFADIFTGLAVNLDHTFRIGDWIEVSEGGGATVGQIEEIGWRSTHLRTEDQKMVVIPNSYLGIHRVTNVSRPSPATRFQVTVTIDFSVPVSRARRVLLASLHAVHDLPGFLAEKEPEVLAADVNDHGLEYLLRYWITPWAGISPSRARDVVTTSAMEHLRTAGITPAYEKTDIFHRDMPLRNSNGHTREDQLGLLARLDLFSMLDQVEIGTIADASRRRHFHAGEVLFRQGDPGDSLFILTEGLLDVFIDEGNGAAQRVGRVLPGEFVGEMSLLTGEPRSATIRALTPCVAYEIGGDVVRALLELRPQIAEVLSHVVAERRLRNADARAQAGANGQQEVSSFARQLLVRMRSFFGNRAPARDATHPAQPAGNGDAHRRTSSEAD